MFCDKVNTFKSECKYKYGSFTGKDDRASLKQRDKPTNGHMRAAGLCYITVKCIFL